MAYTISMKEDGTPDKPKTAVDILKEKSEGTFWGKLTRQEDQKRLEKLLKKQ